MIKTAARWKRGTFRRKRVDKAPYRMAQRGLRKTIDITDEFICEGVVGYKEASASEQMQTFNGRCCKSANTLPHIFGHIKMKAP